MPPCHIRTVKLVAEADLPILPFLAPRVFQPWRFSCPPLRTYYSTTPRKSAPPAQADSLPRRKRSSYPAASSRNRVAKDWYDDALAGLEAQLVHQRVPDSAPGGKPAAATKHRPELASVAARKGHAQGLPARSLQPGTVSKKRPRHTPREIASKRHKRALDTARALSKGRNSARAVSQAYPVRTKWVHVGHPIRLRSVSALTQPGSESSPQHQLGYIVPESSYRWNVHFAQLQRKYDKLPRARRKHETRLALSPKAAEYARYILDHAPSSMDVTTVKSHFGRPWHEIWLHAVIHLLNTSPVDASRFLLLTHVDPYPPSAWVNDCLQYLASHFTRPDTLTSNDVFDELIDTYCSLMNRPGPSPMLLKGSAVRLLLPRCTKEQVLRLFDNVARFGVRVHWNTLLHFATTLAKHDHFDQALDALLDAASLGADPTSNQFESTCATILRKAATQSDGLRVSLRIIQNLSALGVKLNIQHCNIAMLNAVESGDLPSAFSVYHSLVEHGLHADQYTHAILLKGCKTAIEDSETLNATIREAIRNTEVLKSPVVSTEILHCLYMHHFQRNPDTAFSTVAEAYSQLFDATSLIRMHILPADSQDASETHRRRPTFAALGIMVSAYLRNRTFRHSMHSARQQYNLYKHMRMLVERGFQPWASLAETDYVANAFLMAFTSHPSSLAYAAEVIRDMQTPLPPAPESLNPAYHIERLPAKPTVQSWSIFLHGFAKHKKMDLAEQVLQYMREKGMKPNQVTWNSLVSGYSNTRNHDGAVQAFKEMQEEGLKGDEVTFRSLGRLGVDAGMLHQGEEVRDALRARIEREETAEDRKGGATDRKASEALDDGSSPTDDFWDSSQDTLDDNVKVEDELLQVSEQTAALQL